MWTLLYNSVLWNLAVWYWYWNNKLDLKYRGCPNLAGFISYTWPWTFSLLSRLTSINFEWLQADIQAHIDTTMRTSVTTPCQNLTARVIDWHVFGLQDVMLNIVHFVNGFQCWALECPDVKNNQCRLNPVWHRMLYSCTHMVTVVVKRLTCNGLWNVCFRKRRDVCVERTRAAWHLSGL